MLLFEGGILSAREAASMSSIEDVEGAASWVGFDSDNFMRARFILKQEPFELFREQVSQMESSYKDFPEDAERAKKIFKILKDGGVPKPVFVELGDNDHFILEGRHRIVAFKWMGLHTIPTLYITT